jgi:large subunit ribosomal protein LP1
VSFTPFLCISLTHIQADKITALTSAAGVDVEPIWASLLAKALEGKNVKDLLSNVGAGGAAPAVGGAPAATAGVAAEEAPKEEKAKEEEKEESDDDMVSLGSFFISSFMGFNY